MQKDILWTAKFEGL